MSNLFTPEDLQQLAESGISSADAQQQLEILSVPARCRELVRPCTVGDGVLVLSDGARSRALEAFDAARENISMTKFVPASGAASRMFQSLQRYHTGSTQDSSERFAELLSSNDAAALLVKQFFDRLDDFAFVDELETAVAETGGTLAAWRQDHRWHDVVRVLLGRGHLDYAHLPKALIPFHRAGSCSRTALQEHLVEAALLLGSPCQVHFTIHPDHEATVREELRVVEPVLKEQYGVRFDVSLSFQEARTMTVALGRDGRPFHRRDGTLLLRPGGHGSLIYNVDQLQASVVLLGNIDNIVPDHFKQECVDWKKILVGHLLQLREATFEWVCVLRKRAVESKRVDEAAAFARDAWNVDIRHVGGTEERRTHLLRALDRPMRVCGVVKNEGEPGGGPFWVAGADGPTLQIVESAEVDMARKEQKAIFDAASHFNPVNLVCSLTDADGNPFELGRYVDHGAVFIAQKSEGGAELLALERPGLWNGAMSHWLTVFVETPISTFNPVKEVNDLLREKHQAQ